MVRAIAVPTYASVLFFCFVFVIYPSLGMLRTPPLGDIRFRNRIESIEPGPSLTPSPVSRLVTDRHTLYSSGPPLPGSVPALYDEHPARVAEWLARH